MLKSILLHTLSSRNLVHMLCWFAGNFSLYHLAVTLPPITTSPVDGVKLIWFYISSQDSLYGLMIADLQSAWNQWLSRNVACDMSIYIYIYVYMCVCMCVCVFVCVMPMCAASWNILLWSTANLKRHFELRFFLCAPRWQIIVVFLIASSWYKIPVLPYTHVASFPNMD